MGEIAQDHDLNRREVVARLLVNRSDMLVVTGLGSPSYDVMAAGDHDNNFYLWAAMGSAAMVGLGIAEAQPNKSVVVITGDGEMLMGFGSLATIALRKPPNLSIVVLNNGHYGETGMQPSHTGYGINLADVANACGFPRTHTIDDQTGVETLAANLGASECLQFADVRIKAENPPRVLPPRDGVYVKNRFRQALGFAPN
jgi:thiamine pyrophosphate-dependent acetolactate synthase large subunit-like protein